MEASRTAPSWSARKPPRPRIHPLGCRVIVFACRCQREESHQPLNVLLMGLRHKHDCEDAVIRKTELRPAAMLHYKRLARKDACVAIVKVKAS